MNRIDKRFALLAKTGRKGLITFIMGGDPDMALSSEILAGLPAAGADLIEVGMPFSDPMADGPTIQASGLRALDAGATLTKIITMIKSFRQKDNETPIILMGYCNPLFHYGIAKFCKDSDGLIDGVILTDLPPEEEEEFTSVANKYDIKLVRLIAPTTDDARFKKLIKSAGGFLYYISIAGITGTKSANLTELKTRIDQLKHQTKLPIAVGFGIRTPAQAAEIAAYSDAVVVGSALIEIIARKKPKEALGFVSSLRHALDVG